MNAVRGALAAAAILAAGCRGEGTKTTAPRPSVKVEAGAAPASALQDAGPRFVDLLHATPAQVAVSSSVDNPRDKPEHLVDGSLRTAWNSRTGDLEAWIALRVPSDATIEAIELTAGFDRMIGDVDLFTANHRIKEIGIAPLDANLSSTCTRGLPTEEHYALDPEKRGLQRIPFHANGGAYCIFVRKTVPGTKASWKEVTVSELRVIGTPGATLRDPRDPIDISTGPLVAPWSTASLPPFEEGHDTDLSEQGSEGVIHAKPFADVAALCRAYVATETKRAKESIGGPYPGLPSTVACREVIAKEEPLLAGFVPSAPFKGARLVEGKDAFATRRYVVAQTAEGFWLTPIVVSFAWYTEPWDTSSPWVREGFEDLRVDGKSLVAVHAWRFVDLWPRTRTEPTLARGASWCTAEAKTLTCMQWHPDVAPPLAVKRREGERDAGAVAGSAWKEEIPFVIGADARLHRRP